MKMRIFNRLCDYINHGSGHSLTYCSEEENNTQFSFKPMGTLLSFLNMGLQLVPIYFLVF